MNAYLSGCGTHEKGSAAHAATKELNIRLWADTNKGGG